MIDYLNIPLFDGLSKVDIARLVPELEEVALEAGQILMRKGDLGDALFIVGEGRVRAVLEGLDGVTVLETIGPGEIVGEVALLTGQPRSATVRAIEPARLWRLSRQQLDELLFKHPSFALHFNSLIGARLAKVSRQMIETKDTLAALSKIAWASMSPAVQELIAKAAPLHHLSAQAIDTMTDGDSAGLLAELKLRDAITDDGNGMYSVKAPIRACAAAHFRERHGEHGYREWARALAEQCHQRADYGNTVQAFLEAEAPEKAALVLQACTDQLLRSCGGAQVTEWVERIVASRGATPGLLRLGGQAAEQAGQAEAAVAWYQYALRSAECIGDSKETARSRQTLITLSERRSAKDLARITAVQVGTTAQGREDQLAHPTVSRGSLYVRLCGWLSRTNLSRPLWLRPFGAVLGGAVAFLVAQQLSPTLGLSPEANKLMAILACAVVYWVLDVAPEFVVALTACTVALLWGIAPTSVVFSGFMSSTFLLLLIVFGFSALITRSGLAFRVALLGLKWFPATYQAQVWALAVSGLIVSTLIPINLSRLTMVGPLVLALKDTLRFPNCSRGAAGLALAAYVGYGQLSFLFMNGAGSVMIMALLPPAVVADLSWGGWVLAAFPLGLVIFVGTLLTILVRFRPEMEGSMERSILRAQLATLGRLDYQERLSLLALVLLLCIFVLKPWHGVEPGWLAIIAASVLCILGADRNAFNTINYPYLLYFAAFLSLANMFRSTGADQTLVTLIQPYLAVLGASPYLLLGMLGVVAYLLQALLPWLPSQLMLTIASVPLAQSLGYNPFVCGLVILSTLVPGIAPKLGTAHYLYSAATEQRAFTFAHVRELSLFHAAFILLGIMVAIPFWQMLGMVPAPG